MKLKKYMMMRTKEKYEELRGRFQKMASEERVSTKNWRKAARMLKLVDLLHGLGFGLICVKVTVCYVVEHLVAPFHETMKHIPDADVGRAETHLFLNVRGTDMYMNQSHDVCIFLDYVKFTQMSCSLEK